MTRKRSRSSQIVRSSVAPQPRSGHPTSSWRPAFAIGVVVGVTILFVWSKVELATLARETRSAEIAMEALAEEQSTLAASITVETKPGAIQQRAREQLGMVYPENVQEIVIDHDSDISR